MPRKNANIRCNEWLLIAAGFLKIGIFIDVETWERKLALSYCIRGLSRKNYLYIFEVDPLKSAYSRQFNANSARIQPGIKKN